MRRGTVILGQTRATFKDVVIERNDAAVGAGCLIGDSTVEFDGGRISHHSTNAGAGLQVSGGSVTLRGTEIADNHAGAEGGGILHEAGELTLIDARVTDNHTGERGGGIASRNGTVRLIRTSVTGNTAAQEGGGIFNEGGTVVFKNSHVSGNTPDNCAGTTSCPP